jgi:hypothetical protein
MNLALTLLGIFVALYITALPVKIAASAMGAKRTGMFSCLLALVVASFLHGVGLSAHVAGSLVALLLSAVGFAWILGTTFWRGVGIAILYSIIAAILAGIAVALFGVTLFTI